MMTDAGVVTERLRDHAQALARLSDEARRAYDAGRDAEAAAHVQVAAHFAWMNHAGVFASNELERILEGIAERSTPADTRASSRQAATDVRRILHVATQLYPTGGHTQAIRCWVQQDGSRVHQLAVTRQGPLPVPGKITEVLPGRQHVQLLDRGPGGLIARATRLRAAARGADLVILHTHNYDVVPTLAFHAWPGSPPVVQVDSNDHTFWVGRSGADVVMHMRESGRRLAAARRGLGLEDSWVLERPLQFRKRSRDRGAAKEALGLRADQLVISTAADPTKYRPISDPSFLDLVVPVLKAHPEVVLVAAGPGADPEWSLASSATSGRVRGLGIIPDVGILHEAADIYLDSFPFASLTSLLEAGSMGTPVVTYRGHPESCDVLGADTRGLDALMLAPTTPAGLRECLAELVTDDRVRAGLGERTREQIVRTHTGPAWAAGAEALYEHAARRPGPIAPGPVVTGEDALDGLVDLIMQRTGHATGVQGALAAHAGLLPLRARWKAVWMLRREAGRLPARLLLPEWQQTAAALLWHRVKRVGT
jgi:glycosyltransferase involved in cell wall biosynthesis